MVEIFDDRIEIANPGKPLIDTLRFIDHSPKSSNEKLELHISIAVLKMFQMNI
jgi:predicted HTH transcriptional regulator